MIKACCYLQGEQRAAGHAATPHVVVSPYQMYIKLFPLSDHRIAGD